MAGPEHLLGGGCGLTGLDFSRGGLSERTPEKTEPLLALHFCHFASACVVCKRYREETHLSDYPNKHVVECRSEASWLTPNHGAEDNSFGWSWIDSDWPAFHVSGKSL